MTVMNVLRFTVVNGDTSSGTLTIKGGRLVMHSLSWLTFIEIPENVETDFYGWKE